MANLVIPDGAIPEIYLTKYDHTNRTPIHYLIDNNDIATMKYVIDTYPEIYFIRYLSYAIKLKNIDIMRLILNIHKIGKYVSNVHFFNAIATHDIEIVKEIYSSFVTSNTSVRETTENSIIDPYTSAIFSLTYDPKMHPYVLDLLKLGYPLYNDVDKDGDTLLHIAVQNTYEPLVEHLLGIMDDISKKNMIGHTALSIVKYNVKHRARPCDKKYLELLMSWGPYLVKPPIASSVVSSQL